MILPIVAYGSSNTRKDETEEIEEGSEYKRSN